MALVLLCCMVAVDGDMLVRLLWRGVATLLTGILPVMATGTSAMAW